MADRSVSQSSGGVRNIRAMFEARGTADSSPPSRGRSPAASEGLGSARGDSASRPISKVRASFVSVDRASGSLGLQRKDSDAVQSDSGDAILGSRPGSGLNGGAPPLVRTPSGLAGVREEDAAAKAETASPSGIKAAAKKLGETAGELKAKVAEKAAAAKPSAISTKHAAKAGSGPPSAKSGKAPTTPKAAAPAAAASPRGSAVKGSASKPAKEPAKVPAASKPSRPSAATASTPQAKKPAAKAAASPASASKRLGVETSPGGFVKPPPKSPTRPVQLPPGAMATTTASSAKTGRSSLSEGTARTSGGAAPQPKSLTASTNTLRTKPSRQSLAGSTAAADEGFLARMMRPTQSSASKTHLKTGEEPPRARAPAPGSAPKPAPKPAPPKPAPTKPAAKPAASKPAATKPVASKPAETKPKPKPKEPATAKTGPKAAEHESAPPAASAPKSTEAAEPAPARTEPEPVEPVAAPVASAPADPISAADVDEPDPMQSVPVAALAADPEPEPVQSVPADSTPPPPAHPAVKDKPSDLDLGHKRTNSTPRTPGASGTPFSATPRLGTPIAAVVPLDEATLEALGTIEPAEPFLHGTVHEKPSKYVFGPALAPPDEAVAEALSEPAPVPAKPAPDAHGAVLQAAEIEMAANAAAQATEAGPAEPPMEPPAAAADGGPVKAVRSEGKPPGLSLPEARVPAPPPADELGEDLLAGSPAEEVDLLGGATGNENAAAEIDLLGGAKGNGSAATADDDLD